jgi:hypothetical protein
VRLPLLACLTFGALILEAQIAGESLFTDGVGGVVFLGVASLADLADSRDVPA